MTTRLDADLLVAGGGPVGLLTAVLAAQRGLRVVVAEPRTGDVDKACGEGLMPGAVAALTRAGIAIDGHVFRGIRYLDATHTAESRFRDGHGLGVRRTTLHRTLHDAAIRHGVDVRAVRVDEVRQYDDHVEAAGVRSRHLVAADGLRSPVRDQLGLTARTRGTARFGLRRHYAAEPWTDLVEVHWSAGSEVYVTPVGPRLVGVAVLGGRGTDVDHALRAVPRLGVRLGDAPQVGATRGAGPLRRASTARVAGRVLLAGDASGYVDALTGEGLNVGFAQAEAAVDAVCADDLPRYDVRWRALTARYRALTHVLLGAQAHTTTRRFIVPGAARAPWAMRWCVDQLAGTH
jgi:flavin-dependent dehydrogenase